ncbi:MAG: tetratricopeptide repeat protein [Pseudolabrys sp.]|nr:tetratricopeptide repeat protein [Pseudolabrys sp.]
MSDIFHEVDEEVRREQLKKLWARWGNYIVALVVLIVAGVAAWRGYEYYVAQKAAQAGAEFEAAVQLSEAGKRVEAEAAFTKIGNEAPAGYRGLARLRAAAELAHRDPRAAVAAYDTISADSSLGIALQDLAGLRAAMLLVDISPFTEIQRRLEVLAQGGRTFRHTAREILALSAWKANDAAAARRYVEMITADSESPAGTRARAEVISALIASGGNS